MQCVQVNDSCSRILRLLLCIASGCFFECSLLWGYGSLSHKGCGKGGECKLFWFGCSLVGKAATSEPSSHQAFWGSIISLHHGFVQGACAVVSAGDAARGGHVYGVLLGLSCQRPQEHWVVEKETRLGPRAFLGMNWGMVLVDSFSWRGWAAMEITAAL